MNMTRNGALCNDAGEIGAHEFEKIMRGEVITYLQVFLSLQFIVASDSRSSLFLLSYRSQMFLPGVCEGRFIIQAENLTFLWRFIKAKCVRGESVPRIQC
jgi:hypothetical protein